MESLRRYHRINRTRNRRNKTTIRINTMTHSLIQFPNKTKITTNLIIKTMTKTSSIIIIIKPILIIHKSLVPVSLIRRPPKISIPITIIRTLNKAIKNQIHRTINTNKNQFIPTSYPPNCLTFWDQIIRTFSHTYGLNSCYNISKALIQIKDHCCMDKIFICHLVAVDNLSINDHIPMEAYNGQQVDIFSFFFFFHFA